MRVSHDVTGRGRHSYLRDPCIYILSNCNNLALNFALLVLELYASHRRLADRMRLSVQRGVQPHDTTVYGPFF